MGRDPARAVQRGPDDLVAHPVVRRPARAPGSRCRPASRARPRAPGRCSRPSPGFDPARTRSSSGRRDRRRTPSARSASSASWKGGRLRQLQLDRRRAASPRPPARPRRGDGRRRPSASTRSGVSRGGGRRRLTSAVRVPRASATRPDVYPPLALAGGPLNRRSITTSSAMRGLSQKRARPATQDSKSTFTRMSRLQRKGATFRAMAASDDHGTPVRIELDGISVYGHHGVTEAEREVGQRIEIDLLIELADAEATPHRRAVGDGRLRRGLRDRRDGCDRDALPDPGAARAGDRRAARGASRRRHRRSCARRSPSPRCPHITGAAAVEVTVRRERVSPRTGYLGLGSNVGDREGNLRAAIAALAAHGIAVQAISSALRDRAGGRGARPARLPQRGDADRDRARARRAARRLQGGRGRARPRGPAGRATGPARSTSTCCCWATSSSRRTR